MPPVLIAVPAGSVPRRLYRGTHSHISQYRGESDRHQLGLSATEELSPWFDLETLLTEHVQAPMDVYLEPDDDLTLSCDYLGVEWFVAVCYHGEPSNNTISLAVQREGNSGVLTVLPGGRTILPIAELGRSGPTTALASRALRLLDEINGEMSQVRFEAMVISRFSRVKGELTFSDRGDCFTATLAGEILALYLKGTGHWCVSLAGLRGASDDTLNKAIKNAEHALAHVNSRAALVGLGAPSVANDTLQEAPT